ncbi:MAG TPA: peptide ABC transporter substrate-binding protein [Anaerolineales bacterium]|nr:peptide ABC transporter substrate-binding protein [Anaerolineales bacterium]
MIGIKSGFRRSIPLLALITLLFSACGSLPAASKEPPVATPTAVPPPVFTPTPLPRTLTICLGQEPNTLYPFGKLNAAAQSVLAAVDDGPIDTIGYTYQPVILQKLPSISDGDATISAVPVTNGSEIVDADGNLTALSIGTSVHPAGCRSSGCAVIYSGSGLQMDQMSVTFDLRPDLTWSDGTPLTADDSVYAYRIVSNDSASPYKFLADHTQSYTATDGTTVQWTGIPGFIDPTYFTDFFAPAPKHVWDKFGPTGLGQVDVASHVPMGWGPYMIQNWAAGDHITLAKNPYYFRASDGLPKFDTLVFRFIPDPNAAISQLTSGGCDILDPSINLDSQVALLQQMQDAGEIQAFFTPSSAIEWLGLGVNPAVFDAGSRSVRGSPDFFADPSTRQAIALCLDRQKVADTVLFGQSSVPTSFVSPDDPVYVSNLPAYKFDAAAGSQLLEQAGWKYVSGDTILARRAVSVRNVPAGTPLILNYITTQSTQRQQVIDILSQSLAQCGIGINVQYESQQQLYAPGPDGPLFGRDFDLAEFALSDTSIEPPCGWFTTNEVPNAVNHWVGVNVEGYSNPDYDAACYAAQASLPSEQAYTDSYHQAQSIFASDLPAIPLFFRLSVAAARADLCHFNLDPTANPMSNIEAFDEGQACQK